MSIAGAIIENLPTIIDSAMQIVTTLLQGLLRLYLKSQKGHFILVLTLVDGIIANLPALIEAALTMIVTLATGIGEALPNLIPSIVSGGHFNRTNIDR